MRSRRRTMAFYAEHPRQFERDIAARDERLLNRYLNEQDRLEVEDEAREEWLEALAPETTS